MPFFCVADGYSVIWFPPPQNCKGRDRGSGRVRKGVRVPKRANDLVFTTNRTIPQQNAVVCSGSSGGPENEQPTSFSQRTRRFHSKNAVVCSGSSGGPEKEQATSFFAMKRTIPQQKCGRLLWFERGSGFGSSPEVRVPKRSKRPRFNDSTAKTRPFVLVRAGAHGKEQQGGLGSWACRP